MAEEAHRAGEPGAAGGGGGLHPPLPHGPDEPAPDGGVKQAADAGRTVFAECEGIGNIAKLY